MWLVTCRYILREACWCSVFSCFVERVEGDERVVRVERVERVERGFCKETTNATCKPTVIDDHV